MTKRPVPADFKPSFGDRTTSILFAPTDSKDLQALLDSTERTLISGGSLKPLVIEATATDAVATPTTTEALPNLEFPVFHVASILYRSPRDWMLWINGQRVTAKRKLKGIRVVKVGPEQVTLEWRPDHWNHRARVWSDKAIFAKELQNLTAQSASAHAQHGRGVVVASLRANQTFVTAGPLVLEGNQPDYALNIQAPAADAKTAASENSGATVKDMLNNIAQEKAAKRKEKLAAQASDAASTQMPAAAEAAPPQEPAPAAMDSVTPAPLPAVAMPANPGPPPPTPNTLNDILNAVEAAPPPN